MHVIHGLWTTTKRDGPGLVLWFEDSNLRIQTQLFEPISDFAPGVKPRTRGRTTPTPEPHPFALEARDLDQQVRDFLFGGLDGELSRTTLDLLLPTFEDSPLPSPWLTGPNGDWKAPRARLEPWRVGGLFMKPSSALKWLYSIRTTRKYAGMMFGASIHFWKHAANLVFYSLIHGTYEPVLETVDHQIKSRWVLNGSILANQLENLRDCLPTSCQMEWSEQGARRTRDAIVKDFFDNSIDFMVRHVVGPSILDQIPHGKNPRRRKKQNPLDLLTLPFIKAIYSKQNSFSAARDVQAAFVALVSNWLKQTHQAQTKNWHTCFTILPPEIGGAKIEDLNPKAKVWRVVLSLQNNKDPKQHIYAQEVWENLVPIQTASGETLTEQFLKDLGRALKHFPELKEALEAPFPAHVDLTSDQAYHFLSEQSHHLSAAEFGVVLPQWWSKRTKKLTTKLQIDSSVFEGKGMLGFDSVVNFSWKAQVGEKSLSDEAFQKLVKHKMALLPIEGEWVEVNPDDLLSAVTFFSEHEPRGEMSLMDAMHMGLEEDALKSVMEEVAFDYRGSLSQLFESGHEHVPEIVQPETLKGVLRPYQLRGLAWLAFLRRLGFGACLADDMGLGKTIQLLSLLAYEREEDKKAKTQPTLLICPMSVVGNWYREARKFTPSLKAMVHHGASRFDCETFRDVHKRFDLIITTYHLVHRDWEAFEGIEWHRVALDEAQNIKNPSALQTRAILKLDARHRIALTGTPVENKLSELWSIMEFLNPGYLGSLKSFQTQFATPIEKQQSEKQAKLLKRLTQPFILRRLKTDKSIIQDLPEKFEMKVYCNLAEEQATIYQAYVQKQLKEIEEAVGGVRNQLVLTTLVKLKQICNHPRHFFKDASDVEGRSGKLMRLTEMLEEAIDEGDKSLIFTQFTEMGNILQDYLAERFKERVLFLHGGVPQQARQRMVDEFQTKNGPKLFILTVKSGGTGLNLTAANHVFHYDRWWNPAVENQATDRAFRIGQERNVQVHKLISIGTLEDRIDLMIDQKRELAENVIGTDEGWLSELSTDALREVLTLSVDIDRGDKP